jgi:hypothetical protein
MIQSAGGTKMVWSAASATSVLPSVATAITSAPRARTSSMLESTFSTTGLSVATQTTGVDWSSRAIGPCFISPAAYASAGM